VLSYCAEGLKVMVECKPHSRHMLAWLMDKMNPDTDGLFLAVLKAHKQGTGQVGMRLSCVQCMGVIAMLLLHAARMLTQQQQLHACVLTAAHVLGGCKAPATG
jgi:uncharacterized protein VirK/YbjX